MQDHNSLFSYNLSEYLASELEAVILIFVIDVEKVQQSLFH